MARTVILVELVISGDAEHAHEIVEAMLDNGGFQDPINDCADDNDCGKLKVLVARQADVSDACEAAALFTAAAVYPSDCKGCGLATDADGTCESCADDGGGQ